MVPHDVLEVLPQVPWLEVATKMVKMQMASVSVVPGEVREELVLVPWSEVAAKIVLERRPFVWVTPKQAPEWKVPVRASEAVPGKQVETEVHLKRDEKCLRPVTCPPQPQPQRSWEGWKVRRPSL